MSKTDGKSKREMVSSLEVTEACLKSNGREGDPSAFEISLVTEGEKNRDLLYAGLMEIIKKGADILVDGYEDGTLSIGTYAEKASDFVDDVNREFIKINAVLNPSQSK